MYLSREIYLTTCVVVQHDTICGVALNENSLSLCKEDSHSTVSFELYIYIYFLKTRKIFRSIEEETFVPVSCRRARSSIFSVSCRILKKG